jgi:hypothetical protein
MVPRVFGVAFARGWWRGVWGVRGGGAGRWSGFGLLVGPFRYKIEGVGFGFGRCEG